VPAIDKLLDHWLMVGDRFDLSAKVVTAKVEALAFKFDAKTVRNLRLTRRPTATRLKIAPQRTSGLGMQRRPPRKRKSRRLRKRPTRTPQKLRHHHLPLRTRLMMYVTRSKRTCAR